MPIKLTKKEIVSYGYWHVFQNDSTGELVYLKCSQEEYEKLGQTGGYKYNPVLSGHSWKYSSGGTPEIETPEGLSPVEKIGENEYVEFSDDKQMGRVGKEFVLFQPGDIDALGNFIGVIETQ